MNPVLPSGCILSLRAFASSLLDPSCKKSCGTAGYMPRSRDGNNRHKLTRANCRMRGCTLLPNRARRDLGCNRSGGGGTKRSYPGPCQLGARCGHQPSAESGMLSFLNDTANTSNDISQHRLAFCTEVDVGSNPIIHLYTPVIALKIFLLRHRVDVSVYLFDTLEISSVYERVAWKRLIDTIFSPVIDRQATSIKRLPNLFSAIVVIRGVLQGQADVVSPEQLNFAVVPRWQPSRIFL